MSIPKNHHYIPRWYLKRFTDNENFLSVFNRSRNEIKNKKKPAQIMYSEFYYRQPWTPDGIDQNILETRLGELESKAKNAIDRLIENLALNDDDSAILLAYLASQRIRVPRQAETAKKLMRETISRLVPDLIEKAMREGMQLTIKDSARFDYIRLSMDAFHPWFSRMEWEVIKAEDGAAFVTTDNPVSFYNPKILPPAEAGVGLAGTIVLFPLSSRYLLIMQHPEWQSEHALKVIDTPILADGSISIKHGRVWNHETVTSINRTLLQLSHYVVVAESEKVLRQCGCQPISPVGRRAY